MSTQTRFFLLLSILVFFAVSTSAAAPTYLYQTYLLQAAP